MPGWDNFHKGCEYFEEGDLEKGADLFFLALETCHKPYFDCGLYYESGNYNRGDACDASHFFPLNKYHYFNSYPYDEVKWSIDPYSHFYLGLIHLQTQEFSKANYHFQEAIGFGEDDIGLLYFECMNFSDPFWIVCASLTSLQEGRAKLAHSLASFAHFTRSSLSDLI